MDNPIIFHHTDMDGKCGGAIAYKYYREQGMIPELYMIDYDKKFPWEKVVDRDIVMVDFSLRPFTEMIKLKNMGRSFVWIDHHSSTIKEASDNKFETEGLRDTLRAACELSWIYFYPEKLIPDAVYYIGRNDVWDHKNENVVPFDKGVNALDLQANSDNYWEIFLSEHSYTAGYNLSIIQNGRTIIKHETSRNKDYIQNRGFITSFENLRCIACNNWLCGSELFDSVWDPDRYDMMIIFSYLPSKEWKVSLRSPKEEVDCGELAKKWGGGGHKGSAGFQCICLPFTSKGPIE